MINFDESKSYSGKNAALRRRTVTRCRQPEQELLHSHPSPSGNRHLSHRIQERRHSLAGRRRRLLYSYTRARIKLFLATGEGHGVGVKTA
ncbi:hypothetical protein COCON_G00058820 [Conger conger]|uniref:Uncharacterized protein n=1 Tax=Conger conger TaxID=82655 RepID=A0A9Q1DQU8_CONCO|nr:hypothetical protein COCON_G00058820 [Conger conger]